MTNIEIKDPNGNLICSVESIVDNPEISSEGLIFKSLDDVIQGKKAAKRVAKAKIFAQKKGYKFATKQQIDATAPSDLIFKQIDGVIVTIEMKLWTAKSLIKDTLNVGLNQTTKALLGCKRSVGSVWFVKGEGDKIKVFPKKLFDINTRK